MGWSSWYGLQCRVDAATIVEVADALIARGLAAAGYRYVNLDDCWASTRRADGFVQADPIRFPSGVAPLAESLHRRGLKFGIYTSAGTTTCQEVTVGRRLPIGSRGHEFEDARLFAILGADLVKIDWCGHYPTQDAPSSYATWRDAIAATGRSMLLSICEWGTSRPWNWGPPVGNMWRVSQDILPCWDCTTDWGGLGVLQMIDLIASVGPSGGPGGWNDPDSLEVGNGVLTDEEGRAQMSIWAMVAAPLILGADPRKLTAVSLASLTNAEVIAIDQDVAGAPGKRVRRDGDRETWVRSLANGEEAVVVFNRNAAVAEVTIRWQELGLTKPKRIRDLWRRRAIEPADDLMLSVAAHGVVMLRLTPSL